MKKILITISFIVWCIFTLLLAISLVGIVVLIREDHNVCTFEGEVGEAVWFKIGKKIIDELIK